MDDVVVAVGEELPRIGSVEPLDARRVSLTWSKGKRAGETETLDLAPALFNHRHFVPLRDDGVLFRQVQVGDWGSALVWPGDIALSAEWLSRLPRTAMTNTQFRSAMDGLHMTLDGMAATLGVARRSVAAWRKDKPVPPYIALAVRHLSGERA